MTASPGVTYDHDSLGNRQGKHVSATSQTSVYGWDAVNRMTSLSVSGVATSYAYRADGMRVKKTKGADVTRSYYDGQMPVEEDSVVSGTSSVTRNFVGARGIESIFTTTTSGTTTAFPLYDCHGNMVATVARSGPGFTTSNVRTYDVWGGVRTGATTGGPKGRYVANLGHVQDDESGLIYMRARYYEPESGRFISEDPARDGSNWYIYCKSDPINFIDESGTVPEYVFAAWKALKNLLLISGSLLTEVGMVLSLISSTMAAKAVTPAEIIGAMEASLLTLAVYALGFTFMNVSGLTGNVFNLLFDILIGGSIGAAVRAMATKSAVGGKGFGIIAIVAVNSYMLACFGLLASSELESMLDAGS